MRSLAVLRSGDGSNEDFKVMAGLAVAFSAFQACAQEGNLKMEKNKVLETIETMTSAFARGDVERIVATYEAHATVIGSPGTASSGDAALRSMFADFIAAGVAFKYGRHEVVVSGDIALHLMKWSAPGPDGEQSALSVAVLRRQDDGSWKMVIDHPFGDSVLRKR
jgi:ketosteroid isomerase-like protein